MAKFADEEPQPTVVQGIAPAVATTPQTVAQPVQQQTTPTPAVQVKEKAICHGCKMKLAVLNYKRCTIESGVATTDGISKMIDFEHQGEKNEVIVFTCPACAMLLFADEDDAVDFLDGA